MFMTVKWKSLAADEDGSVFWNKEKLSLSEIPRILCSSSRSACRLWAAGRVLTCRPEQNGPFLFTSLQESLGFNPPFVSVSDSWCGAAAVEWVGGPPPVGLRLAQMQQAQPPEAAVDRVPADRAEPAQPPQRAGAAHHPRGLLGREREVRETKQNHHLL